MSSAFLDSNVVVYAFSEEAKAERARDLLHAGEAIGVQTLNEFANVSRRKLRRDWAWIRADTELVLQLFPDPVPLDLPLHREATRLSERYQFSVWDAMMVAAALRSGCDMLWSEDLHDGLVVEGRLQVVNPFRLN